MAGVQIGRAQEVGGGVRADPGFEGWHGAEHAAQVRHDDGGSFGAAPVVGRAEGDACGDGVDGGILAAGVQPARRPFQVWVVNAQHIKKVPGRKTDMKDAEWIAQLLQCGLLKPSFVPERQQRELRDLTRQQTKLVQQRNAVDNRIQKVLETANIKLGSVASDVLGVSGRKMIEGLLAGEKDVTVLADLAQRIWPSASFAARYPSGSALWKESLTIITAFCCGSCSHSTTFSKRRSQA